MNRKRYSGLLFGVLALSLILFGIPWQAFAYHSGSQSDLVANPELMALRNYRGYSLDDLALVSSYSVSGEPVLKIDSVRWSALGFYYAQSMTKLRGAEVDSARWAAVGDSYAGLIARGVDAESARWAAMGDHYTGIYSGLTPARAAALIRQAALVDPGLTPARAAALVRQAALAELGALPPDSPDSIRRTALGVYYAKNMAGLRGAEADSARWVAMGVYYSPEMILARQPEFNPYQSALGLYYTNLASNPELLSLQRYETCGC